MNKRETNDNVRFCTERLEADGKWHISSAQYNRVTGCVTYFSDLECRDMTAGRA